MNRQKIHWLIDWGVIITFLIIIWCCFVNFELWKKVTYIAPVYIFLALSILFFNHISLNNVFIRKS